MFKFLTAREKWEENVYENYAENVLEVLSFIQLIYSVNETSFHSRCCFLL